MFLLDQQPSKACKGNDDVMTYDVELFNNYSPKAKSILLKISYDMFRLHFTHKFQNILKFLSRFCETSCNSKTIITSLSCDVNFERKK